MTLHPLLEQCPSHETVLVIKLQPGMLAAGGNSGGFGSRRLDSVECYDLTQNQWREIESMTKRRSDTGITVIGHRIYVVGGFSGTSVYSCCEVFQGEGNGWLQIKPMSTPRSGVSAVGMGGKLYVVGGWNGNERLRSGEVYDPKKGKWKCRTLTKNYRTSLRTIGNSY